MQPIALLITTLASLAAATMSQPPPVKYAVALFNGFQLLDVAGPLDVLAVLALQAPTEIYVLANTMDPVTSRTVRPGAVGVEFVPTHTFETAPEDIEVLIVPGGGGARDIAGTQPVVDYIAKAFPKLRYFLTVCTGAALAGRAGVLDGKNATTNKLSFDWAASQGPKVNWIRHARWVTDGNIWTSSGISAGIDMTYGFVVDQHGEEVAAAVAQRQEYIRNTDPNNDPFAPPESK